MSNVASNADPCSKRNTVQIFLPVNTQSTCHVFDIEKKLTFRIILLFSGVALACDNVWWHSGIDVNRLLKNKLVDYYKSTFLYDNSQYFCIKRKFKMFKEKHPKNIEPWIPNCTVHRTFQSLYMLQPISELSNTTPWICWGQVWLQVCSYICTHWIHIIINNIDFPSSLQKIKCQDLAGKKPIQWHIWYFWSNFYSLFWKDDDFN